MAQRRRKPAAVALHADTGPSLRCKPVLAADGTVLREPTAEITQWRDPDDDRPQARQPRVIQGARAADPLLAMHQRGGLVTTAHMQAADRLRDDYETGIMGARLSGNPLALGAGGPKPGQYPDEARLFALEAVREAFAAVGANGTALLLHVVLGVPDPMRRDVHSYAAARGIEDRVARGMLIAVLDRLAEHYAPKIGPGQHYSHLVAAAAT